MVNRTYNNNIKNFNRTGDYFISTAWSHCSNLSGQFNSLAGLKFTGQLFIFHEASSGNFRNDISDISLLLGEYILEFDDFTHPSSDTKNLSHLYQQNFDCLEISELTNKTYQNKQMIETMLNYINFHLKITISCFVFSNSIYTEDKLDTLQFATKSGEIYQFWLADRKLEKIEKMSKIFKYKEYIMAILPVGENHVYFAGKTGKIYDREGEIFVDLDMLVKNMVLAEDHLLVYSQVELWSVNLKTKQKQLIQNFMRTIKLVKFNSKINSGIIVTSKVCYILVPDSQNDTFTLEILNHPPAKSKNLDPEFKNYYESASFSPSGHILSILTKKLKPKANEPIRSMMENRSSDLVNFHYQGPDVIESRQAEDSNFQHNLLISDKIESILQKFNPDETKFKNFILNLKQNVLTTEQDKFIAYLMTPFNLWTDQIIDEIYQIYTKLNSEVIENSTSEEAKNLQMDEICPITDEVLDKSDLNFASSAISKYQRCSLTRQVLTANKKCKNCILCDAFAIDQEELVNRKCRYCGHKFRSKI